ncbi:FRG domain-containing protein [Corynebacterium pseudodiphtheriticum]|uniref:FRG domain-containing protein n=1 Tax=Corynebacterium pseudodiphtheriticum TaxID=37637 RepID=UPI00254A3340|nr:FRG domain-containing protein [Corynebacterium pseudodiphtheriticum]MDK8760147.1 FRG domain-containing protein [Corynebacterium pseudodiphtheriticum]
MVTFADKFFSERELAVLNDDRDPVDDIEAKNWFDAMEQTIATLPLYEHNNMGSRIEHHADNATNHTVSTTASSEEGVWFFRGQKDASFAFNSTLYRKLLDSLQSSDPNILPKKQEDAMLEAELDLLKKAKRIGIGRGLSALETLTLLQHHGSPTRLVDITSDWKVALFFACENNDSRDARIFFIKTSPKRWASFPRADNDDQDSTMPIWQNYAESFPKGSGMHPDYNWLSGTWPILLPFSDPRMISQRGFFLVGGLPSLKGKGYLYTSQCSQCENKLCTCFKKQYGKKEFYLDTQELRQVTSLPIRFGADLKRIASLKRAKLKKWKAIGYSVRIKHQLKPKLRSILRDQGVHADSIYPPLHETVRLFENIVDDSFTRQFNDNPKMI